MQKITFNVRKNVFAVRVVRQAVQRGCMVSIIGDIQNPTGGGPGQPALGHLLEWGCVCVGFLLELMYLIMLFFFPPPKLPQSLLKTVFCIQSCR